MDLSLPIPSLKELSMVAIGRHLANKLFNGSRGFQNLLQNDEQAEDEVDGLMVIVKSLGIPHHLHADLYTVLSSMEYQSYKWLRRYSSANVELVFNVHGILDDYQTWLQHFEREVTDATDALWLDRLFKIACYQTLLPLIGVILRKIVALYEQTSVELEGPRMSIVNKKLVLAYTFANVRVTRSGYKAFRNIESSSPWQNAMFDVTPMGVEITLDSVENIYAFEKYFNLLDPSQRAAYVGCTLRKQSTVFEAAGFVVDILKFLKRESQLVYLSEVTPFCIFKCFLVWPLTRFFMPLMRSTVQMRIDEFYTIFTCIVNKVLEHSESSCVLYRDLLLEFWNGASSSLKHELQHAFHHQTRNDAGVFAAMRELHRRDAATYLAIAEHVWE